MKIGLALGGGGLRGAAHIGVLKVLLANGIKPVVVIGTSAGSIVAGMYASGIGPEKMESMLSNIRRSDIYDPPGIFVAMAVILKGLTEGGMPFQLFRGAPNGFLKGQRLKHFLRRCGVCESFDDTEIPCAVVAVEIDRGRQVVFTDKKSGRRLEELLVRADRSDIVITDHDIPSAIRASTAIPGVFRPEACRGMSLVDGGVKDNVPVELAFLMGADLVIAVDLGYAGKRENPVDNIFEYLSQSLDILAVEAVERQFRHLGGIMRGRILRVSPGIYDVSLGDIERIPECIKRGEEAMKRRMGELFRMMRRRPVNSL